MDKKIKGKSVDKKKNHGNIDWKSFEELVGRLEHMVGNNAIKVKVNDQIRDNTGELRQVDASIWVDTGTTKLLYIIECRNRHKVSDVTWVEQISTKARRIKAVKAILVSNKQLTSNAILAAAKENIDIRTLQELDESIFADKRVHMTMERIIWSPDAEISIEYVRSDELSLEEYNQIYLLALKGSNEIKFSFPHSTQPKTFEEIVNKARRALQNESFAPGVIEGNTVVEFVPPQGLVELIFNNVRLELKSLSVKHSGIVKKISSHRSYSGHYKEDEGILDHVVTEQSFDHGKQELTFTAVSDLKKDRFTFNVPYEFFEPEFRDTVDKNLGASLEFSLDENKRPQVRRIY